MATTNRAVAVRPTTSTAMAMFDPENIPGHIVKFNEDHSNIGDKLTVDSLTYKGKAWHVNIGGNKETLMKVNEDGDPEPRTTIPLVILGYQERRGRSFYDKGFEDDKPQQPTCWSPDSITPDPSSLELQADKCANCPMSVKGSKPTESNPDGVACQGYRLAAVQLYRKWPEVPPLRLRLAVTSDWDGNNKDNEANGWYAFSNLIDFLRSRGVKHTSSVVVKAKFDNKAYPKVLFSPTGWIDEDDEAFLAPLSESLEVAALLSQKYTPAGGDNVRTDVARTQAGAAEEDVAGPVVKPPKGKAGKPKALAQPEPEPEPEAATAEKVHYVDENGNPCDEDGNPLPGEAEDAASVVEAAEADDDDPEVAAKKAAEEARARALAKQAAKIEAAAAQARAARVQPEDEGEITLGAPKPPKGGQPGRPTVVNAKPSLTPAKPAATVVATKPRVSPAAVTVVPKGGAAAAGKAGKPATPPVSGKVGALLQDWKDD